jgi:hypothetical protein
VGPELDREVTDRCWWGVRGDRVHNEVRLWPG